MQSYAQQGLLRPWPLPNLTGVPPQDKTTYFWGTRVRGEVLGVRAPSGAGGAGPAAAQPDQGGAAERPSPGLDILLTDRFIY
jgi:hypothetical protein